jgi:hypothetical protein
VNIKLPKTILSAFFADKGFKELKSRAENFFSEEIFIQEAIDLMKPRVKKKEVLKPREGFEKIQDKTISGSIVDRSSEKDMRTAGRPEITKEAPSVVGDQPPEARAETIEETELSPAEQQNGKKFISEKELTGDFSAVLGAGEAKIKDLTPEEIRAGMIDTLFCEETYRKKIIRRIFRRDEKKFREAVSLILDVSNWKNASSLIAELFDKNRTDYLSEEAIKFVDIIQNYFSERGLLGERSALEGNSGS